MVIWEPWERYSFKDAVHDLSRLDEHRAEAIHCLGQMASDPYDAAEYCPWATNEQCIVDCIRSIFGKGILQGECNERREAWGEYK